MWSFFDALIGLEFMTFFNFSVVVGSNSENLGPWYSVSLRLDASLPNFDRILLILPMKNELNLFVIEYNDNFTWNWGLFLSTS